MRATFRLAVAVCATGGLASAVLVAHVGSGLAFDEDGRIYFADTVRDVVWRIEADGRLTLVRREVHTNRLAVSANGTVDYPVLGYEVGWEWTAIGPDSSRYRAERNQILRRHQDGSVVVAVDSGAGLDRPQGVAVDASGNIFVADYGNRRVVKVTPEGMLTVVARTGWLWWPTGVGVWQDRVYLVDRAGNYWGPSALLLQVPFVPDLLGTPRVRVIHDNGQVDVVARVASSGTRAGASIAAVTLIVALVGGAGWYRRRIRRGPKSAEATNATGRGV